MGLLGSFFVASPFEVRADTMGDDPGERYPAVSADRLTPLDLERLLAAAPGGEPAPDAVPAALGDFPLVLAVADEGPWVMGVPDRLVAALAGAAPGDLATWAERWVALTEAADEGLDGGEPADAAALLGELTALARTAREAGRAVYFWMSL